jgi:signal transduction histidine kinase
VNTPLGVVQSSTATAESCAARLAASEAGPPDSQKQRLVQVLADSASAARQAAQRIAALVSRLRDFAGLDQAEVQETRIESALDRTLDLVHSELKGSIRVLRRYGDTPPVVCRAKELNQVFFTLITNALEAMRGQGTLSLETGTAGDQIVVSIADTGGGMRDDQLRDLFEIRFATKGDRVGIGLGLPMARSIVEKHGGSIAVDNREGHGLSFRIVLPVGAPRIDSMG